MTKVSSKYRASFPLVLLGLLSCLSLPAQQTASIDTPPVSGFVTPPASEFLLPASPDVISAAFSDDSSSLPAASLPDAPQARTQAVPSEHTDGQTKRILGIIPNFRAVSSNVHLPPQTVKDKFVTASEDSFDYSAIVVPAVVAAYDYEINATPEFGTGGVGYGRYLWHSVVDQTSENYMVEFIVPAITHEDTRYYTLGHGGFLKRTGYALSRAVVTRDDAGKETFNISEVVGAGAAAGISNLYYPTRTRSLGNTGSQWGLDIGIDSAAFVLKEFWPDINHYLFHGNKPFNNGTP